MHEVSPVNSAVAVLVPQSASAELSRSPETGLGVHRTLPPTACRWSWNFFKGKKETGGQTSSACRGRSGNLGAHTGRKDKFTQWHVMKHTRPVTPAPPSPGATTATLLLVLPMDTLRLTTLTAVISCFVSLRCYLWTYAITNWGFSLMPPHLPALLILLFHYYFVVKPL